MIQKKCLSCSKKYFAHNFRKDTSKFCSKNCADTFWRGKKKGTYSFPKGNIPWSKLHPELMKPNSGSFKKGERGYWFGKENLKIRGDKNNMWIGGGAVYCRNKALKRDNYICDECGFREPAIMEVHHIKSKKNFPKLKYNLDNLQTLCPNCHKRKTIKELKAKRINKLK